MEDQKAKNKPEEPITGYLPIGEAGLPTDQAGVSTGQAVGRYTYADYLAWELDQMVELIKGKVYQSTTAPKTNHQRVSVKISAALFNFLEGKPCEVFGYLS